MADTSRRKDILNGGGTSSPRQPLPVVAVTRRLATAGLINALPRSLSSEPNLRFVPVRTVSQRPKYIRQRQAVVLCGGLLARAWRKCRFIWVVLVQLQRAETLKQGTVVNSRTVSTPFPGCRAVLLPGCSTIVFISVIADGSDPIGSGSWPSVMLTKLCLCGRHCTLP